MSTHLEDLENKLVNRPQQVLLIAGAGVSIATDPTNNCAGWTGLLRDGLKWCRERHALIDTSRIDTFESLIGKCNPGDLISVAGFIVGELRAIREGEYSLWLERSVGQLRVVNPQVIDALLSLESQIATTNYDRLIEAQSKRGSITWREPTLAIQFLQGDLNDILHIHGDYRHTDSVVLDARSYEDICRDQTIQSSLQAVLHLRTLVFVGCGAGLSDPNFGNLLSWSRKVLEKSHNPHYLLVKDDQLREISELCRGTNLQPISYGLNHCDLGPFLAALGSRVRDRRSRSPGLLGLVRGQDDYASQIVNLRAQHDTLQANEYLMRHLDLARRLIEVGGLHTAALDMDSAFQHESARLSDIERVQVGLEVAEMLLDDKLDRQAATVLNVLLPSIESGVIPSNLVARIQAVQIRCMNQLCAYNETMEAISRALPSAVGNERSRLQAERAEIQMLQGDLIEALQGLEEA